MQPSMILNFCPSFPSVKSRGCWASNLKKKAISCSANSPALSPICSYPAYSSIPPTSSLLQVSPLLAAQGPLFGRALVLWPGATLRSALVPYSATGVELASRAGWTWCLELARLAALLSLCQMLSLGQQGTFLRWPCGLIGLWSIEAPSHTSCWG